MRRPLLLLDVDGVISLFGFDPLHPPAGRFHLVDGIVHYLSATAAEHLDELGLRYELVWCTGWEERADEHLPAALGLPRGLNHLTFGSADGESPRHWKLAAIDAFAGPRRATAWIDDVFDESCHAWAAERAGPTRLVQTAPAVGLTAEHVDELIAWADELAS
jgi:hypothetical protein